MTPLDPSNYGSGPRVVEFPAHSPKGRSFRVVCLPAGPVIELADGKDSLGEPRWIKALLLPDRRGLGEPVYEGWKEISSALGCSVRTAMRYAGLRLRPLPVLRGVRGPYITRSLLTAWLTARTTAKPRRTKGGRGRGMLAPHRRDS